jgi:ribosomal protein L7/L12
MSEPPKSAAELRTIRIRELQAELHKLLDEEAAEACNDLARAKDECVKLAKMGCRIEAIKLYREKTGLSLREAMQVVDGIILEQS